MIKRIQTKFLLCVYLLGIQTSLMALENDVENTLVDTAQELSSDHQEHGSKLLEELNDLAKQSVIYAPFVSWFTSACQVNSGGMKSHHRTFRNGVKITVMNACMMAGMIGFHFIIKPHNNHHAGHGCDFGTDVNGKMMCQDLDGSGHVPAFMSECTIPHGAGGVDHHFLNCTWHENDKTHGDHIRALMEEDSSETSVGTQIGRLFLSMEIGMQLGHISALWINKLLVDPLFNVIESTD